MKLDKGETPGVVLALQITGITTTRLHQHATLPPTAFARITGWSHGQVSVNTGLFSEQGNAKPVLLPVGPTSAATELNLSLWDRRETGDIPLDLSAEVTLPAPSELGDSEQLVEK